MDETICSPRIILFFFLKKGKLGGSIDRLYPDFCKANAWPVFWTESNSSKHSLKTRDITGLLNESWTQEKESEAAIHGFPFGKLQPMAWPFHSHPWDQRNFPLSTHATHSEGIRGTRNGGTQLCTILVNLHQEQLSLQLQGQCLKDLHLGVELPSQMSHLAFQHSGLSKTISLWS